MKDQSKTKQELLTELASLRRKIAEFEEVESSYKKAEESLRESEEMHRQLVENANCIIVKIDHEGRITFFNNHAQELFGYTLGEIIGKDVKILVPPIESTGRSLEAMVDDVLRNPDGFVENINENILKNGDRVWISWRNKAIRDSHGDVVGILAIGQDITKLKLSEEALRESEQCFRSLFENSIDGMMVTVVDGSVLSANARMCEILGMSEKEIIDAGREGIAVQDERLEAGLKERAHTGRFRGELTLRRKDGSLVPVELSSCVFEDVNGTVKTGHVVRDITERKHSAQLLKQAYDDLEQRVEERTAETGRQAELLNLAHDAIVVWDEAGKITFWNAGAQELYGWNKEQAMGNSILDLLRTKFPVPLPDIMDKAKREGRWEGELVHTRKDGRRIVVLSRWALRQDNASKHTEIMEVNRDITAHKEDEEALRKAGAYNRSLIETSLDPLVTIGPKGKITDVNAATEEVTGYSREELIGTDFSSYITDSRKARTGYKVVFKKGFVRDYELEIRHRDGHTTPVFYNASVYKDWEGKAAGVFAAARDITERKQAEEELLRKSKALEELNTALKVLIDHYKNDQRELEERIVANIRVRIVPYIEKLKRTGLDVGQSALIEIIERSFRDISSPFLKLISAEHLRFTPKEVEIASLIREGKTTKEIAKILGIGKRTADSYRDNIRSKLGLANKKVNLRTYLLSISNT